MLVNHTGRAQILRSAQDDRWRAEAFTSAPEHRDFLAEVNASEVNPLFSYLFFFRPVFWLDKPSTIHCSIDWLPSLPDPTNMASRQNIAARISL